MAQRTIVIQPQLSGIVTKNAFQKSQSGSAYDSFNMWPIDVKTGRVVPGTRPKFNQLTSAAGNVTLLEGVSGKSSLGPFNSFVAGIGGTLYFWNGSGFTAATGAQAGSIDTARLVSAAPFINQVLITRSSNKPIIFDYPTGVATTVVESVGTAPSDARIAVPWQGTVWLSAQDASPHILYAPRVGDLTDWDYTASATDQFGAFFTDTETAGKLSGPVTALMPQTSDTMIVSTIEGMLAMRGHPRQGGVIELVNKGRYVLGQGAWCRIPGDILLFLTPLGIMSLDPSSNATPALLSKTKIPEELIGLPYSYSDPTVTMVYDNRWNQVHLFNRGTFEQGWTLDLETGSFHRISAASYPYTIFSFPEFDSEQSSGTLYGRYDGIYYLDKFATESVSAGVTLNPIMLSQSTMTKGIIDRIRVILGRDSPSSDLSGSLRIAVGIDAQDAVSKALNASFDFTVDLQTLKTNNGVAYPKVSGQAAVFSITHSGGDVSIEEIHADISDAGHNRGFRSTQFQADGEVTNFSEGVTDLDVTQWTGYQEATPAAGPSTSLTDYTHFLDLSLLDSTWWATVETDGRDIRVSTTGNVELPADLVSFDYANQGGMLAFKFTQSTTPIGVRVWVGNPDAVPVDVSSTYGQYNAYDNDWRAFYPLGDGADRTRYVNTLTDISSFWSSGAPAADTGPMGAPANDVSGIGSGFGYYRDDTFMSDNTFSSDLSDQPTWTFVIAAKKETSANITICELLHLYKGSGLTQYFGVSVSSFSGAPRCEAFSDHTTLVSSQSGFLGTVTDWNHYAGTFDYSVPNRTAYLNGVAATTDTSAIGATPNIAELRSGFTEDWPGSLAMAQLHTGVRSAAWIAYQNTMMDQATFWGTTAFVQVNAPHVLTFSATACPSGVVPVTETGTWSGYAAATPDNPTASLINVLHFIDLSAMPADWWTAVASDGSDIRATNSSNIFLPFDLIDFDSTAQTGFAVVKQNQFASGASQIRLWVGNATAVTLPDCSSYGRYATYDEDVKAFWPAGSGTDRTQWLNNTATVTPDSTGPIGNEATDYTGTIAALANASIPGTVPYTFIAAAKTGSGTLFKDGTIFSLTSTTSAAACMLKTTASASPARYVSRRPTGAEVVAGNNTVITAGSWWLQSAVAFGSTIRSVLVNGGGTSEATVESAAVAGLSQATIGGQTLPDGTKTGFFDGLVSLVQLHAVAQPDAWVAYQNAMLNQTTFWNTWAWTADSDTLPQ